MTTPDRLSGRKTLKVSGILDEFEKDRIKADIDIVSLFESFGVSLTKKGKNYMGRCPWHEDSSPSLSVDKEKGLYNCFGCGESGDAFSLVEKIKGLDFKNALEYLKNKKSNPAPVILKPMETSVTVVSRNDLSDHLLNDQIAVTEHMTDQVIPRSDQSETVSITLEDIVQHWVERLHHNEPAQKYLESRGLTNKQNHGFFSVGYSDGSLVEKLSEAKKKRLVEIGILNDKGREVFEGFVTVPLFAADGQIKGIYGRSISDASTSSATKKSIKHLYLKGPLHGLINRRSFPIYRDRMIFTESVIDALSLYELDIKNVCACYGTNGFKDEHLKALKDSIVKELVIAFDADEAGRKASSELRERLISEGFSVKVIEPAVGKDWNESLTEGMTEEDFEILIDSSVTTKTEKKNLWRFEKRLERWVMNRDDLHAQVIGNAKRSGASLRLSIRITKADKRFIDHLDLYSARSRSSFCEQASFVLGDDPVMFEQDLFGLMDRIEELEDNEGIEEKQKTLSEEESEAGMQLLTSENLFEQIVSDMTELGYVGEDANKLLVYLAATSRKLDDPVSVIIVSQSAAGKSYLIDTVKALMPEEDVVNMTSLSDQALNYMADGSMIHKLLVMGEAVHNEVVEHQIREMLSAKELSRMVVTKDEQSGKLISRLVRQKVLVSLMMSSTQRDINPENASRCFFVHADESEEQTKRIHEEQNKKYTLEKMKVKKDKIPHIIMRHQSAQRLLRPLAVVNPLAHQMEFPVSMIRSRRDNKQLGDLAAVVCFLRQYQKEIKEVDGLAYIECDQRDIQIALDLFRSAVLKATYLEMSQSLVRLYEELRIICREQAASLQIGVQEVSFDQSIIRKRVNWLGAESIKKYLKKLVYLEYVTIKSGSSRGQRIKYQLISDESLEALSGMEEVFSEKKSG